MAINNTVRAWNSFVLNIDSDPSIAPGVQAGIGSIAIQNNGDVYYKTGASDTAWTLSVSPVVKGGRVLFCFENGEYATGQDAVNAATNGDTIVFGPKTTSWGSLTIPAQKRLALVGLQGQKATLVTVGAVTFSPAVGSAVQNEVNLCNLLISVNSGSALTFGGTAPARLKVDGCYFYNGDISTSCVVSNSGSGSSAYFYNSIFQADSGTPIHLSVTATYTKVYYCSFSRGSAGLNLASGFVELVENQITVDSASSIVNLTANATLAATLNLFSNTTTNGSGISLDATSTIVDTMNTYSIATGTGYCMRGTGVQIFGPILTTNNILIPSNVNIQNTVNRIPLTLNFTAVP